MTGPAPVTRILEVSPVTQEAGPLLGWHVDAPAAGDSSDTYAVDVRGWALGREQAVTAVEVMHEGVCVWRVPVDIGRPEAAAAHPGSPQGEACGFFTTLNALNLPAEFELLVRARLEDRTRVPMAVLRGAREVLRSPFEPRLRPLMVTTLGRTGSTAMVRMLRAHPRIVAYRPFEYEPRVATYWMGVFKSLSEPVSYRRQITPTGTLDGAWWLGLEPPLPRPIRDPALQGWLGTEGVGAAAAFCQSRMESLYDQVAAGEGRADAAYFAEKLRPDRVPALMWELYPDAREIVLVRDFRDMVSSMFAFNRKRGFAGFRRDRAGSDAQYILENVKNSVSALARAWERRSGRAHLVRYEDLVTSPAETAEAVLAYAGLEAHGADVEAMAASVMGRDAESEGHRTISDPGATIGRWRTDLDPELQRACEDALAPALELFGYALEPAR